MFTLSRVIFAAASLGAPEWQGLTLALCAQDFNSRNPQVTFSNHLVRARQAKATVKGNAATASIFAPALLVVTLACIPLGHRVIALVDRQSAAGTLEGWGVLSDLLVSAALAGLVLATRHRLLATALVGLGLGLLHHANLEHLTVLGGSLNWFYADQLTEGTFLRGSVLEAKLNPGALCISALATAAAMFTVRHCRAVTPRAHYVLIAAIVLGIAAFALPYQAGALAWRQANVIAENLNALFGSFFAVRDGTVANGLSAENRMRYKRALVPTVANAKPRFALGYPGTNVLLVLIEGVSGAYLRTNRERLGLPAVSALDMPHLDRRLASGFAVPHFVANQRQTSRGEYAILCGDYPALVTHPARMTTGEKLPHVCLPEILNDLGYQTVYLQAAPLSYNRKDAFMPAAGFERAHGVNWFEDAPYRTYWGVDDGIFFEGASRLVNELQTMGKPWFLTLLTVGTHHPYWKPVGKTGKFRPTSLGSALEYADQALDRFIERMKSDGILEDTLVIVTSDESAGFKDDSRPLLSTLAGNWSTLLAFTPQDWRGEARELYMQADIPISILDYLGQPGLWQNGVGRSLFRQYEEPRSVAVGNTYSRMTGLIGERRRATICDESFGHCDTWVVGEGSPFKAARSTPVPARLEDVNLLRALASHSLREATDAGTTVRSNIVLSEQRVIPLAQGKQFVLGGQDWWQRAGEQAEIELEFAFQAEGEVLLTARSHLVLGIERILIGAVFSQLRSGEGGRLRFDFVAPRDTGPLQVMMSVSKAGSGEATLEIVKGEVRFPGTPPKVGDVGVINKDIRTIRRR